MEIISGDRALGLLELAVVEKGSDHIYDSGEYGTCRNVHVDEDGNKTPGCIVGHAVFYLVGDIDKVWPYGPVNGNILNSLEDAGYKLSPEAYTVFKTAQFVQDSRYPWGAAITAARGIMEASNTVNISYNDGENA